MPATSPGEPLSVEQLARRIRVAQGQEPADLTLVGGQVVNVFTQRVEAAQVAIVDGVIAGVGPFDWPTRETVDLAGGYLLPGLIDAHMHLESTLLAPAEFARLVAPHGTSAVVADPHEVANVLGIAGVEVLLAAARELPIDVFFMASSCVPSRPWEDTGAAIDADGVEQLLDHPRVLGLAEVMDFPAVLSGEPGMLGKLLVTARCGRPIDGHAPGLPTQALMAYAAAGIRSDHESSTVDEALAKAALGMLVQVREGSAARNLDTLLPLIAENRLGDWCLCTDDIYPDDLRRDGHIDGLLRRVVAGGVPAPLAVRHATLVPARHYGLTDRGAVAPGCRADLLLVDNLSNFTPRAVWHGGQLVARDGQTTTEIATRPLPADNTVRLAPLSASNFHPPPHHPSVPTIRVVDNQIVTQRGATPAGPPGTWQFRPDVDLALAASVERHRATGRLATCLVEGFGLRHPGAIGSTVAHDAHNLVLVGTDGEQLAVAAHELAQLGGGWVVVEAGRVAARLPLPFAGLLSRAPAATVIEQLDDVRAAARRLGCPLANPFGALSFLSLPVIPALRLTTRGLFDVESQSFVSMW